MASLTNAEIESICQTLSPERLAPYLKATKTKADALELYKINITLCQLMYLSLNTLEITLRNAIDRILRKHYGEKWLTNGQFPLEDYEAETIQKSLNKLGKRNQYPSQDQLIADLSFGFWQSLFHKRHYDEYFWRPHGKAIFPHAKRKERSISIIEIKLNAVRILRNRVSHHEPIWKRHADLFNTWNDIYCLVGWINPDVVTWMRQIDKFKKIYNEELDDRLEELINHQE